MSTDRNDETAKKRARESGEVVEHRVVGTPETDLCVFAETSRRPCAKRRSVSKDAIVAIKRYEQIDGVVSYMIKLPNRKMAFRLEGTDEWFERLNHASAHAQRKRMFEEDGRVKIDAIVGMLRGESSGRAQISALGCHWRELCRLITIRGEEPMQEPDWVDAQMIPTIASAMELEPEYVKRRVVSSRTHAA